MDFSYFSSPIVNRETKLINLKGNSYLLTKQTEDYSGAFNAKHKTVDTLVLHKVMPDGYVKPVQNKVVEIEPDGKFDNFINFENLSRRVTKENLMTGEKLIVEDIAGAQDYKNIHLTRGEHTDVKYSLAKDHSSKYSLNKLEKFLIENFTNKSDLDKTLSNSGKRIIRLIFR